MNKKRRKPKSSSKMRNRKKKAFLTKNISKNEMKQKIYNPNGK